MIIAHTAEMGDFSSPSKTGLSDPPPGSTDNTHSLCGLVGFDCAVGLECRYRTACALKTRLLRYVKNAHERATISYFFRQRPSAFQSVSSDQTPPKRATSRFIKKLDPYIIAQYPHVWSLQYWDIPNGVPQCVLAGTISQTVYEIIFEIARKLHVILLGYRFK